MKPAFAVALDRYRRTPRGFRWIALALLVLGFAWVVEDLRGRWLLARFHREAKALGVDYEWTNIKPALPLPKDDFVAAPIVAEWFEAKATKGKSHRDTRLGSLDLSSNKEIVGVRSTPSSGPYAGLSRGYQHGWLRALGVWLDPPGHYGGEDARMVLEALGPVDANLDALVEAAGRPACSLLRDSPDGDEILRAMLECTKILELRARARIQTGESQGSVEDVIAILRIADHLTAPDRRRFADMSFSDAWPAIWEGTERQVWDDQQLLALSDQLAALDLAAEFPERVRRFRARMEVERLRVVSSDRSQLVEDLWGLPTNFTVSGLRHAPPQKWWERAKHAAMESGVRLAPPGVFHHSIERYHRSSLELFVAPGGVPASSVDIGHLDAARASANVANSGRFRSPYAHGVAKEESFLASCGRLLLQHQQTVDKARIALALERWRLAHGNYPDSLAALVPEMLSAIPQDRFEPANPIRYVRTPNGRYKFWASGANRVDEGGSLVRPGGDSVWQFTVAPVPIVP